MKFRRNAYCLALVLVAGVPVSTALAAASTDEEEASAGGDWGADDELFMDVDLGGDGAALDGDTSALSSALSSNAPRFTFQQEASYKFNEPTGVQTNRSSLRLEWEKIFNGGFYAKADVKYNLFWNLDNRLEEGEAFDDELRVRNTYIQKNWGQTSVSLGQQIIVWGETETAVVTDVFSPRNQSDFIFTSLEESRLGQVMLKLDQYTSAGHFSLLVNPDVQVDDNPFSEVLPAGMVLEKNDFDPDPELGFRWRKVFGRADYSLFLADINDNSVVYRRNREENGQLVVNDEYNRYQMFGAATNYTTGNTAIQGELAFNHNRSFQTDGPFSAINDGVFDSDQLQASVAFNYTQNGTRSWILGVGHQYLLEGNDFYPDDHRHMTDMIASVSEKFWYETLTLSYVLQYQFTDDTAIHKLSSHYQISDNLSLRTDLFYLSGFGADTAFDNQSILFRLSYSF